MTSYATKHQKAYAFMRSGLTKRNYSRLKKVFFIFFLLITSSLAYAGHDVITIKFKDGQTVQYRAKEYWTYFNLHPGYFKYNQKKETGRADADYYCVADYVSAGSSSPW